MSMSSYGTWDDALTAGVLPRRVCGWLVDLLLIGVICAVLWGVLLAFGVLTLGLGLPLLGLLPIVPFCYHLGFLLSPAAATPGQSLFGLVVCRDEDLGRPEPLQALIFTVGLYLTLAAGVIWLGIALFTIRRRALHDMAAGLVVVRRRVLMAPLTRRNARWNMRGGFPSA
jgi:uncharacterized RDD family membrane protein YckC